MSGQDVVLVSPLSPVALATRLQGVRGDNPYHIVGSGSERTMRLWIERPDMRNDFKPVFEGDVFVEGPGTRIEGRFAAARGVRIFMTLWLGFVGMFLAGALVLAITLQPPLVFIGPFVGIPALMLLFGLALSRFGGGDRQVMLGFLTDTVEARPIPRDTR